MDDQEPHIVAANDPKTSHTTAESGVLKYLEFYFSDFNLNQNKHLRSILESSPNGSITLDQLLTFNKIQDYVLNDKSLLLTILSNAELKNAKLLPESESVCRNPEHPFVYDKNFLKNKQDLTIYVGNLAQGITMGDLVKSASTYGQCAVYPKKRDSVDRKKILSALVVFDDGQSYQKFLTDVQMGVFSVGKNGPCKNMMILPYHVYDKERNKLKKKKKHIRFVAKFLNISIGQEDESPPPSKLFGLANLVAMRTLLIKFTSETVPEPDALRNSLDTPGILFLYRVQQSTNWHYYVLFKNRHLLMEYFSVITSTSSKLNDPLVQAKFGLVDENNLPCHYEHYVKCIKHFLYKKPSFPLNIEVDV